MSQNPIVLSSTQEFGWEMSGGCCSFSSCRIASCTPQGRLTLHNCCLLAYCEAPKTLSRRILMTELADWDFFPRRSHSKAPQHGKLYVKRETQMEVQRVIRLAWHRPWLHLLRSETEMIWFFVTGAGSLAAMQSRLVGRSLTGLRPRCWTERRQAFHKSCVLPWIRSGKFEARLAPEHSRSL